MHIFAKKDMKNIVEFFMMNIDRFLKNDDFEFCLSYIKSHDDYKKIIAQTLRKTDCVFECNDGIVLLLSGANKQNTKELTKGFNSFLNNQNKECIAFYPYDGTSYDDLVLRLNELSENLYGIKIIDE